MVVSKIRDGLWRWEVSHPDWNPEFDRPDGWGRMVGCVYAEYDEAVVLIDPLVPRELQDEARFWRALDSDIARLARPLLVLVGSADHGRSVDAVVARYKGAGHRVAAVGDAALRGAVSCTIHKAYEDVALPAGLHAVSIPGMSPGERAFVLDPWRAVVFADAVIGCGSGSARVAPPSWGVKTAEGRALYDRDFRHALRDIAAGRPESLLPSHGDPVFTGGAAALDAALGAPPWGD